MGRFWYFLAVKVRWPRRLGIWFSVYWFSVYFTAEFFSILRYLFLALFPRYGHESPEQILEPPIFF